jgi:hypothetical protein
MPILATANTLLTAADEPDLDAGACPACGSNRLEFLAGYFESGATGPNGETETYWRDAVRCRDCGEVQEF